MQQRQWKLSFVNEKKRDNIELLATIYEAQLILHFISRFRFLKNIKIRFASSRFQAFVLFAILSIVNAQIRPLISNRDRDAVILKQIYEPNPDGSYVYSYETSNGIAAQQQGFLKNPGTNVEAQVIEFIIDGLRLSKKIKAKVIHHWKYERTNAFARARQKTRRFNFDFENAMMNLFVRNFFFIFLRS